MAKMTRSESGGNFEPCPEGMQQLVCVDIIDCGYKEQFFEGKSKGLHPMIKLVFASENLREDGKPFLVYDRQMKWSFHEKASLYKRLAAWIGAKRVDEMLQNEEDIEVLIGINALGNIEHNESNGTTYANVGTIGPIMKNMTPLTVGDYERMQNRDGWVEPVPSAFDEPEKAKRILARQAGQQEMDIDEPYTPVPAYPHEEHGGAQPHDNFLTDAQHRAILSIAGRVFGRPATDEDFATLTDKPVEELSKGEASALIDRLRFRLGEQQGTPLPAPSTPAPSKAIPQNNTSAGPIKDAQLEKIYSLSASAGGPAKVREMCKKKFGVEEISGLNADQAQNLIFDLKAIKPAKAVANKAAAMEKEEEIEPDPFADEGEPSYIADDAERERVLNAGKQQPELVGAGAPPYPAN